MNNQRLSTSYSPISIARAHSFGNHQNLQSNIREVVSKEISIMLLYISVLYLFSHSLCRDCVLYQVLLPSSVSISSFTHLSKVFFALLTTSSEVNGHRVRVLRNIRKVPYSGYFSGGKIFGKIEI